jgi:magnesium transporter
VTAPVAVPPSAPASTAPRIWYRAPDGQCVREFSPQALREIVRSGEGTLWVDIDSRDRRQFGMLEHVFGFHPLAIEDVLNPATRPKIEEYPDHLFVVVRAVRFREETPEDPYDVHTYNIYFFLTKNVLVTAHAERSPSVSAVEERIVRSNDLLDRGAGRLMHGIMDATIDQFFPIMDQLDPFVDGIEERVFERFDQAAMQEIFKVKRLVLNLRRHLTPQREVFNALTNRPMSALPQDVQIYFRDIYDHVLRLTDSLDAYRELLTGTMDAYLTQVSNRLGRVTKGLSAIATVSIPFVIVSGMWGMNFDRIPLAGQPEGFWLMLVIQLALGGLLLLLLRWRGML